MNSQMKFLFAILLTGLLGMGLAGCEAEGDGSSGGNNNPVTRDNDQDNDGVPDDVDLSLIHI